MLLAILVSAAVAKGAPQQPTKPQELKVQEAAPSGAGQSALDAGLLAFKKRRYAQAEVEFRKAMEADATSAAAPWYLGYTYYKMCEKKRPFHPDKQKAADMFKRAYELDPLFRPVWASPGPPKK